MKAMVRYFKLVLSDTDHDNVQSKARTLRKETEEKIDKMSKDLNGCPDDWMLSTNDHLNECSPGKKQGDDIEAQSGSMNPAQQHG